MAETSARYYQSFSSEQEPPVSWKRFYVHLAGKTDDAHHDFVRKLKDIGQTEVWLQEDCDYLLVFCPIVSRVKTDISDALDNVIGHKPIILVVMHHTFNPKYIVAGSRRHVSSPKVRLTVDCFFYNNKFLKCEHNDAAWQEVQAFLGVTYSQVSLLQKIKNGFWSWSRRLKWLVVPFIVGGVMMCIGAWIFTRTNK